MMYGLFAFLFGRRRFYSFETMILQTVICRVGGDKGLQLKQQIEAMNYVQRLREGREVNMYRTKYGKEAFDDSLRFSSAPEEERLASVVLQIPPENDELKAEVWMAHGRIFSLEFDKPPKDFFPGGRPGAVKPGIKRVTITLGDREDSLKHR